MVREEGDPAPDVVEYKHGLTPPMRDARRRRFRREPDLNVLLHLLLSLVLLFMLSFGLKNIRKVVAKEMYSVATPYLMFWSP